MRFNQGFVRQFVRYSLLALSLSFIAIGASASPASPVSGTEFRTLDKPQPTEAGKKIEVIEFFWYSCPHCAAFEPALSEWVKKQGDNISFKRVPVMFREQMIPEQRLFYALEAMGKAEDLQKTIFNAIHKDKQVLNTEPAITDFVVKQGIDKTKFSELYNSFSAQTKVRRAAQMQEAYKVNGVPMIVIDGRFVTAPSIVSEAIGNQPEAALQAATLQVMDHLLAKAGKEHKAAK
ncbi:thiol:disulfide interchange protein DsbA [soil metagenome]